MSEPSYILDIEWDRPSSDSPKLPPVVGPFDSWTEAREWAGLNIPNGSWEIRPVAWPYATVPPTCTLPPAHPSDTERAGDAE